MKIAIAGVIAAAAALGALSAQAAGFDVQTEGGIFLNEVAQIPQMHDPDKFRRVVQMRFAMFTLAYTTSTPIFSGKKFDVSAHLTNEDYGKAAKIVKVLIRGQPFYVNPALDLLRNIVENCASSNRCGD